MGTSSASVNTTQQARTASAARRASKPSPGRLVPTCQHPMDPPTPVRTHGSLTCSICAHPSHQSDSHTTKHGPLLSYTVTMDICQCCIWYHNYCIIYIQSRGARRIYCRVVMCTVSASTLTKAGLHPVTDGGRKYTKQLVSLRNLRLENGETHLPCLC